ncbi:MAG: shikimate dehydrogenase [Eggerthellaceae bacterium]|nr:shikimate dehydrogenase [Eggerthellaceae bacterium]
MEQDNPQDNPQVISGATRLIGLIGSPVRYSNSPAVHNASFEEQGLDYRYVAFDVTPVNLLDVVRGMKAMGFLGYNITAPCKTFIVPYLDEISEVAELSGAVNTVVIQNGRSLGDNADGASFMRTLVLHGINIRGKKITVLGAGGTAASLITQAALDGVAEIDIFNRIDEFYPLAQDLIDRLRERTDAQIELYSLEDTQALKQSLSESTLVVNATSVGSPNEPGCLLTEDMMTPELIVSDMVYVPRETELIKRAKANGNKVLNGVDVFLQQAAMGERLWIGCEMPIDYIKERFYPED